jgi:deoxyribonuclease V
MDLLRARAVQERLRERMAIRPLSDEVRSVAGVDAAFRGKQVIGCACLFSFPALTLLEEVWALRKTTFPYIPGYLSFREAPALIAALKRLKTPPDLVLVDGQGIAHPRRMGIASHLGLLLNVPTVGCAKSRLIGRYQEPGPKKGDWSPLLTNGEVVGAVLRTRQGVKPLFVSPGHRITLPESIKIVQACTRTFRLPEPLRRADHLSKILKNDLFMGT